MQTQQMLESGLRFTEHLRNTGFDPLQKDVVRTLQINLGKLCNQTCVHCHVDAGPARTEVMSREVVDRLCTLVKHSPHIEVVDLTGGAPELNPHFNRLVQTMREMGREVIDRCNLTILTEPGMSDKAAFLAASGAKIVASLPCYTEENVDAQRGNGAFDKSISALKELNQLGYGTPKSGLVLDLVYNPGGAFLPGPQPALEADYKARLGSQYGIEFNHLRTIVNMPINRFADRLSKDREIYLCNLVSAFNPATISGVMCRSMVSVSWDGKLYDCDFNQVLDLPMNFCGRTDPISIFDIHSFDEANETFISTASHCFGCTAGSGSSCSGAIEGCTQP